MTRDFSQNISRVSRQPPVFYICSEDFKPLGIRAPLFGAVCFVLVYAIPGKTINNKPHSNTYFHFIPFSILKEKDNMVRFAFIIHPKKKLTPWVHLTSETRHALVCPRSG